MNVLKGQMVRLNVAQWYRDPEFQTWFNSQLGKGLATWCNAAVPLKPVNLPAAECREIACNLMDDVITADVLFEPINAGSAADIEHEQKRLKAAEEALNKIHEALEEAGEKDGLTPALAEELADLLQECVLDKQVFFDPDCPGDDEVEKDAEDRVEAAVGMLYALHTRLSNIVRQEASEDLYAYADCFVGVEPECGEGTDSDMPERFWDIVVDAARQAKGPNHDRLHVLVWLCPTE